MGDFSLPDRLGEIDMLAFWGLLFIFGIGGLTAWTVWSAWSGAASLFDRISLWFRKKNPTVASLVMFFGTFVILCFVTLLQGSLIQVIFNAPLILLFYAGISALVMLCYALLVYGDLPKTRNTTQRKLLQEARMQALEIKQASFRIQSDYKDIYETVSEITDLIQQILRYAEKEDTATETKIRKFAAVWLDMTHNMVVNMTEYLNSPHRKDPGLVRKYKETLGDLETQFNKQIDDLVNNNWDLETELEVIQTRIKYE